MLVMSLRNGFYTGQEQCNHQSSVL